MGYRHPDETIHAGGRVRPLRAHAPRCDRLAKDSMPRPFRFALCVLALASTAIHAAPLKVVTIARTAQFDSLDPVLENDVESARLVGLLYDSLLQYRYLARVPQLEP